MISKVKRWKPTKSLYPQQELPISRKCVRL